MIKKRIQVVPISSDERSARSADTSRSNRSRIRLRNSSSKYNKRQQQLGFFGKRPYLYRAADQSTSASRYNILYPKGYDRNGNNTEKHITPNHPIHWIDWLDSGMELFGCGITTGTDVMSPDDENHQNSMQFRLGSTQSSHNLQREQDILAIKKRHLELLERDYVQLHEDFFDSLLKEEGDQMLASTMSLQQTESKGNGIKPKNSSSFSVGSTASSGITSGVTTETNRTLNAQNSRDSNSNHTRTSTKSGLSVSSTRAVRLNRRSSFSKKRQRSSQSSNFVHDQQFNTATSTSVPSKTDDNFSALSLSNPPVPSSGSAVANGKKSSSSVLCIRDIMTKTHLQPSSQYLHMQCKLQKDKGKGESLGSSISARGKESTLIKLRDKMRLIVEVSGELQTPSVNGGDTSSIATPSTANGNFQSGNSTSFKAMSAGMKRRKAKISSIRQSDSCADGAEDGSYVIETRSMIELQLGFLSMQYGLLLHWDAYQTGQIVFVCLRKMCHDSFYSKIRSPPTISTTTSTTTAGNSRSRNGESSSQYPKPILKHRLHQSQKDGKDLGHPPRIIAATKKRVVTPPLVVRSPKGGNHAIYQRTSGATEVVLVDAPYRVPHPDVFAPSILTLDIHRLSGLDPKSRWTLIMTFDGVTEIAHLKYNSRERIFETTRTAPCKWEISMMPHRQTATSFDVATGLEIRLFEQRPKRRLRGVANGVAGIVGGRSISSSYVPPGSDPFSMTSLSNSYIIQNQRLIHFASNTSNQSGNRRLSRTNSENSIGSSNSSASGSTGGNNVRRSSKKSTSRLASTMTVPLGGLVCQPSTSQTTLWKLTIPFTHDEDAEVTLTLMHQSDYAHWLYQELRARRKEELASASAASSDLWRLFLPTRNPKAPTDNEEDNYDVDSSNDDSDDLYFMEWLYYCCFDPR